MTTLADLLAGRVNPSYDAQQVAGDGIVGQALLRQRQQLNDPAAPQQDPMQPQAAAPPMAIPQGPRIRQGFTYLDPKDWTPEEHAVFRMMHGIPNQGGPPQANAGVLNQLMRILGIGGANAGNQGGGQ